MGLNAWGTQLNPVFGDDAHVFRPERWLPESYNDNGSQIAAMTKVHELIFGHGMTRCLGIPIAMMNLNKIFIEVSPSLIRRPTTNQPTSKRLDQPTTTKPPLFIPSNLLIEMQLFRKYDVQCINNQRPWTSLCYGIFFQKDFHVRITRRVPEVRLSLVS